MSDWQVQDAKARFSELLNVTLKNGPQVVTRRGIAAAVLVSIDE
jgi:antitoxin Phd